MAKIAAARSQSTAPNGSSESRATENTQVQIEKLAYQYYLERGFEHGHHEEDWLRAETAVKTRKK